MLGLMGLKRPSDRKLYPSISSEGCLPAKRLKMYQGRGRTLSGGMRAIMWSPQQFQCL